jgi:hypothetical protein
VKSGKPMLLLGWGGQLFPFELSAEQAAALKLGERGLLVLTFQEPEGRRPEKSPFTLSDLRIDDGRPKLTGTVAYRRGAAHAGPLALRLSYPAGPGLLRVRREPVDPKAEEGKLAIGSAPLTAEDPQLGATVVVAEVCSAEGAGKPEAVLSNPVATVVMAAVGPPNDGLAGLRLAVPEGWTANYNKFLNVWDVTKPPPTPRSEAEVLRIEECPADARTAADYAAHLKEKDFLLPELPGWVELGPNEELSDGFVIKGVVKAFPNPKTPPVLGLLAVREIGGLRVRCLSATLRRAESRDEALAMFKGARFGPPE